MYGSNLSNLNQRSSASSSVMPTPGRGPPSEPLGIIDDKPLTTEYDDALEEQREEALSHSRAQEMARERERIYQDPPPGFCDAMLPQTREGRLMWTIILILIVVGICIVGVVMTLGNRSTDKSGLQGPIPTFSPSLNPNDDALGKWVLHLCYRRDFMLASAHIFSSEQSRPQELHYFPPCHHLL